MAASTKLGGNPCNLKGDLPKEGDKAPDFRFVRRDLSEGAFSDFDGKARVLIGIPSVETGVCANETRQFNDKLSELDVKGVVISEDLPFALERFCSAEGIENVEVVSDFRYRDFVEAYNTELMDGGFKGLSARVVFVVDPDGKIVYSQLVPEIGEEPDYDPVLDSVKKVVA